jgi:GH35 family endo-1,4-beta-xylanase
MNLTIATLLIVFSHTLTISTPAEADQEAQNKAIQSIRKGTLLIQGEPGSIVKIKQLEHEFWFGCAISSHVFFENTRLSESDISMYKEKFLENFNSAVTENAVKWGSMERKRGQIDYRTPDNILDWTEANNIPCRGHNLYWGINQFVQDWVKELPKEELREAVRIRGIETAKHFKGRFAEYDLNNEMIHGNYYADKLGEGITGEMAGWVLEGDEEAKLWLNDYDILTGKRLGDFLGHIRTLLREGVPISGIGVQGHLHGETFSREELKRSLDSLGQFGLPVRITEFNMPGQRSKYYRDKSIQITEEEEITKAGELRDYYRICFAHPAVEGILMWGFWEGANWIKASSLYRRDWSPTPALEAYQDLIFKEWRTNTEVVLDENGEAEVPAFYGHYKLTSNQETVGASLEKKKGIKRVKFQ